MPDPETAWAEQVRSAVITGDEGALRELFAQARLLFGPDAGHRWAEVMSGLDGGAQTG